MRTGPWNKKAVLQGGAYLGLGIVLLAVPVAPAAAQGLRSATFARLDPPQMTTLPTYRDPWSGLRYAPVVMRYEAPISEPMSELDPRFLRRVLDYPTREKPGSIIIDTRGRYLYYVEVGGKRPATASASGDRASSGAAPSR